MYITYICTSVYVTIIYMYILICNVAVCDRDIAFYTSYSGIRTAYNLRFLAPRTVSFANRFGRNAEKRTMK